MTIFRDLSIMYASMFSLIIFMTLFESRLSKKKAITLTLMLMIPLLLVNFALMFLIGVERMNTVVLLTCSLPSLLFFWFIAKYRDGRFFFTFCFSDSLILWIIDVTGILDFFFGGNHVLMLISRLILCPALAFALGKWFRPLLINLQHKIQKGWWLFSAIVLLFYLLLSLEMSVPTLITERLNQLPAFIIILILMPVIYIHIFTTLIHQIQTAELIEKENILNLQVSNLRARVEEFNDMHHTARMERHDFRHKMQTILALLDKQQTDELRAMVLDYSDQLSTPLLVQYCDFPVLDAVFASYQQRAKKDHIKVSLKLNFPKELPVPETELATAFANALDNAFNACLQLPPENRTVDVIALTDPCFMFQIRNTYKGMISMNKEGIPTTNKKGHGYGTRSIVAFCNKHELHYEFKAGDTHFALRISTH